MRVLWLTPYLPAPVFGGGTRVFNFMKALAPSCDIDLIASADRESRRSATLDTLRSFCHAVEIVPQAAASRREKRLLQVRSLLSGRSSQFWTLHSRDMQARIDRTLREVHYDVVILEHSFMGYYAVSSGPPTVLDQHNVESEILLRASRHERSLVRRGYNLLEYWKYRSDEERICRSVDLIVATSGRDCEAMERWSGLPPCLVIPNGVDTTYFAPAATDDEEAASLLFTGSMHYAPNAEAMLYFAAEIWPLIQQRVPHAILSIVGGNPPPEILQLGVLPNVSVRGRVPDVRPYLSAAQVIVAPLRIGGGTRLKILEAMAMGKAVVSTSVGCEGLEVRDGQHLLVADEPAAFAAKVTALLGDAGRRAALGREGRLLVENMYDWHTLGLQMEAALGDLVAARRGALSPL